MLKMVKKIHQELTSFFLWFVISFPKSVLGSKIRNQYWSYVLHIKNLKNFGYKAFIINRCGLDVGLNFSLGDYSELVVADSYPVFIGDNVALARGTYLRSANHSADDINQSIINQGHESKRINYLKKTYSIVIEDDVWIGANVIILSGTFLGRGSIVSAGSVVSAEIPPFSIVVGNPARVVANRKKLAELKNSRDY